MSTVRLSDRQQAALLALDALGGLVEGHALATQMRAYRPDTSVASAHQAANGLLPKGLAVKKYAKGAPIRYEITDKGRGVAGQIRSTS